MFMFTLHIAKILAESGFLCITRYFKTQSKLTHFIKSMFQKHEIVGPHSYLAVYNIPGPVEVSYTR